jgi:hypothetical protein
MKIINHAVQALISLESASEMLSGQNKQIAIIAIAASVGVHYDLDLQDEDKGKF